MPAKASDTIFYFARKNRRGSLVLLLVVVLCCLLPFFYPLLFNTAITEQINLDTSLANLKSKQAIAAQTKYQQKREDDYRPYDNPRAGSYTSKIKGTLFYFDPNTLTAEEFKKLGLRDKTIATILNFRTKGGKFRQSADIKKIWGLFPDEAERLVPYVQIAVSEEKSFANNYTAYQSDNTQKNTIIKSVEINGADTAAFIALPGIGSKLSQRIINFRDKLGGFYHVDQVGETFGLPDSVFKKIKPLLQITGEVKKMNINTATLDELKSHPYIKYHLANAIVQYRMQHGDYKSVADIRKIMIVNDEVYNKTYPYLKIE